MKKLYLPNRNVTQPWAEQLQNFNIRLHQKLLALTWLHMIFSITIIIYYCIEDHGILSRHERTVRVSVNTIDVKMGHVSCSLGIMVI